MDRGDEPVPVTRDHGKPNNNMGPVKLATILAVFWGIAGFAVGLWIAPELAFRRSISTVLHFVRAAAAAAHLGRDFRLRRQVADRNVVVCRAAHLPGAAVGRHRAVVRVLGYNFFIVIAGTGYLLGITQSKEYAEPEWYADLWLTIVWVVYLLVFLGTIMRRKEPHIYVANWFYLAFIVTIAVLHIGNNAAVPVSVFSPKCYIVWAGVQDAMVQWWYGHNAVGFFLTAGFLAIMYYFIPKRAERPIYCYRLSIVHFWALIFIYIWAGPHHLHYTALPDWTQTLGMTFSIMLWMPSWGGMINGLMTLSGAWDKLRTDPVLRMLGAVGRVLRHGDLRRSGDVDQGGQFARRITPTGPSATSIPAHSAGSASSLSARSIAWCRGCGTARALFAAAGELALLDRDHRHRRSTSPRCGCRASCRA